MQRQFVTVAVAAGVRRSGGGYSSTATVYLSLYDFFLVVCYPILGEKKEYIFCEKIKLNSIFLVLI
jgi:hypothetical protein